MADDNHELPGRHLDDASYTRLIESLSKITLIGHVVEETDHLTRDDLVRLIAQMVTCSSEAMAFAGVTEDEAAQVTRHLLTGMSTGREPLN